MHTPRTIIYVIQFFLLKTRETYKVDHGLLFNNGNEFRIRIHVATGACIIIRVIWLQNRPLSFLGLSIYWHIDPDLKEFSAR